MTDRRLTPSALARRKFLPVGTVGRVCGMSFVVTKRASRIKPSGAWCASVVLTRTGKPDTAYFGDEHVLELPERS